MKIQCGGNMMFGLQGITAPQISMVTIDGGNYHRGNVDTFQMGIYPVTYEQFEHVTDQLGTERYFVVATDPSSLQKMVVARGNSELLNVDAYTLLGGLRYAGMTIHIDELKIFTAGLRVVELAPRKFDSQEGCYAAAKPVVNISWDEAIAFSTLMKMITGIDYSLPTEFQWEWAARGGDRDLIYGTSTGELSKEVALYSHDGKYDGSAEVDAYPPMMNGLYQMTSNVWEWMLNVEHDPHHSSPLNERARALRGGSFLSNHTMDLEVRNGSSKRSNEYGPAAGFRLMAPADPE